MAVFNANFEELEKAMQWVRDSLTTYGFSPNSTKKFEIAIEEALVNIIQYAFGDDKEHSFEVRFVIDDLAHRVDVILTDEGKPFNPLVDAKAPDIQSKLMQRKEGGLGIHFIRKMVDEVSYERKGNANILILSKFI